MEPTRNSHATLVDLLDRVLDKGLVIHADLIISLAGVPLIGVNLRTALAGMETMLKYGLMTDWDECARAWEGERRKKREVSPVLGEEIILEMLGSYYYSQGIYTTWRMGRIYLTDKRLLLYHPSFEDVLFETPLQSIKGLALEREEHFTAKERKNLCLLFETGNIVRLHAIDTPGLKEALEQRLTSLGLTWHEIPDPVLHDEAGVCFLRDGEEVACSGKMWHLMSSTGILPETWKPGRLYLTNERLCWWYDLEGTLGFDIPVDQITGSIVEIRTLGAALKRERVLEVVYQAQRGQEKAAFSGGNLVAWERALSEIALSRSDLALASEMETCPQCGRETATSDLPQMGCAYCGWVSPKLKGQQRRSALESGMIDD